MRLELNREYFLSINEYVRVWKAEANMQAVWSYEKDRLVHKATSYGGGCSLYVCICAFDELHV